MWILIIILIFTNLIILAKMLAYRKASLQDNFTALPNYSALCRFIKANKNTNLTICILDIDNFKEYNKVSISKGDEILKEFATILKQKFVDKAFIARYRLGDEFALVFDTNIDIEEELNQFNDFLKTNNIMVLNEKRDTAINFSYGTVMITKEDKFIDTCLENAEKILAENKRNKKSVRT